MSAAQDFLTESKLANSAAATVSTNKANNCLIKSSSHAKCIAVPAVVCFICNVKVMQIWHPCVAVPAVHTAAFAIHVCQAWKLAMLPTGEGEKVALGGAMKARGGPEGWLTAVEALMRSALRAAAKRAIKDYPVLPRAQWVRQQPAQLVLLVSNIFWCKQVTNPYILHPYNAQRQFICAANSMCRSLYANMYTYV